MSNTSNAFQDLDRMVSQLFDESLSPADKEILENVIRENPEARRRYADLVTLESMLHWEFAGVESDVNTLRDTIMVDFSAWWRPAMALAACFVATLIGWWVIDTGVPVVDTEHEIVSLPLSHSSVITETIKSPEGRQSSLDMGNLVVTNEPNTIVFGSESSKVLISSIKPSSTVNLARQDREALLDAAYGLEILESGQGFGEGGYVEVKENVSAWRTEDALRVGAEFGVQPYQGGNMLRFSRMEVDVFGKKAEVSELVSVLDVRSHGANFLNGKAVVKSSVCFNQGVGIADGSTSFALGLHAINREGRVSVAIAKKETSVTSDVNPETWERVESEIELPEGTHFVVVSLSAHKEGSQALLPDLSGHYADGLEIAMVVDGRPVYSRL
ncbi:MAG: hypothetical protein O3A82_01840 [Verrucomicrobia bacterium]|nr:hypothetical protein [Verrucomicrobiota bacterium]MDA1045651.1 hypothetical protein [Verrucomicrobiota bacterium]